jgi:AcrR family transcriptional regulator
MAERKRPRRTRERILETSLRLFNDAGEPNISTAHIADDMGISPGNLYYHFRSKDEIVRELFLEFERRMDATLTTPSERPANVEDIWLLLHLLFEVMWEHRFVYRDLEDILSRHPRLASHYARLLARAGQTITALSESLVATGAMRASREEIAALARNVLLVMTYWLPFQRLAGVGSRRAADRPRGPGIDLDIAAYQVLSLVAPYLLGDAKRLLEQLRQDYVG